MKHNDFSCDLTASILLGAALSGWRDLRLTAVRLALQGAHALRDGAHHVAVEAVAVLTRVLGRDVGAVGVELSVHGAAHGGGDGGGGAGRAGHQLRDLGHGCVLQEAAASQVGF